MFRARIDAPTTRSELFYVKHVQEMFPSLDSVIRQRLGRTLTQRRQCLKDLADQYHRLQEVLDPEEAKNAKSEGGGTTGAPPISQGLRDSAQIDITIPDVPASVHLTASYLGSDVMDTTEIRLPSLPQEHTSGPFLCPFCFTLISMSTLDEWKSVLCSLPIFF